MEKAEIIIDIVIRNLEHGAVSICIFFAILKQYDPRNPTKHFAQSVITLIYFVGAVILTGKIVTLINI